MIDILTDAEVQAAAGVIVSFSALLLALFARNKRAAIFSGVGTVLMFLTALDLMTNNLVLVGLAETMGLLALFLLLAGLAFVWQRKALAIIGHLFAAAFFGLMSTNLGIERFGSRSEWWYNFQTFEDWATGATLILLLPAIAAAFVKTRQIVGELKNQRGPRESSVDPTAVRPSDARTSA